MCQLQTWSEPITDKKPEAPWVDCLCSKGHKSGSYSSPQSTAP